MSSLLRLIEYFIVRVLDAALQAIPSSNCALLMSALARVVCCVDSRHRRRSIDHLRLAYGDAMTPLRAEAVTRRVFEHIGLHAAHFARRRRKPLEEVRIHGADILLDAVARGKGVVLVSAHLGYFTDLAPVLQSLKVPSTVLLKRQHNPWILRWFAGCLLSRYGMEGIVKSEALEKTPSRLRNGRVVLFFADQHPVLGGIPATFFSRPVESATGPALFARRYRAPLVVVTSHVRVDGTQEVRFEGPVSTEGTLAEISQRWLDRLEARIREHPEQWLWMHRRWRHSGTGSTLVSRSSEENVPIHRGRP